MKLIAISDVHLNFWKAFSEGHGAQGSRFLRTLGIIRDSLVRAQELKCPWVCAGDWVHTIGWSHNPVLTYLIQLLRQFEDVEKLTVWGNHDGRSHGPEIGLDETVVGVLGRSVPNLIVLDRTLYTASNGLRFYGEGYQPSREFLCFTQKDSIVKGQEFDVGVLHQTVSGSKLPSGFEVENSVSGVFQEELLKAFKLSIVGDIHHPQQFMNGTRVILVPGSPEHHNFGDLGPHGWWECDVESTGVEVSMISGKAPEFLTVEFAAQVKDDGNYYRVLNPCDPKDLPGKAIVVSAPPVVVEERNVIKEGAATREILQAWVTVDPPPFEPDRYLAMGEQLLSAEGLVAMRPVRLERVVIRGFMCFAEERFDVRDGVTLVVGEARDFESNGAGKTTLFEAIYWALFGRTTKGMASEEVIQWGQKDCEVELILHDTSRDQQVTVRRSRSRGGAGSLSVETGPKDGSLAGVLWGGSASQLTDELQKYLGITPSLFQALAYFSQSKLVLFSQATDSERKGMLSDLCGLEVFQHAAANARSRSVEMDNKVQSLEQRSGSLQNELDMVDSNLENFRREQAIRREEKDIQTESLKAEDGRLGNNIFDLAGEQTRSLTELDQKFKGQLADAEQQRTRVREILERQIRTKMVEVKEAYEKGVAKLSAEAHQGSDHWRGLTASAVEARQKVMEGDSFEGDRANLQTHQEIIEKDLKKIGEIGDKCPTCGKDVDPEWRKDYTSYLKEGLDRVLEKLKAIGERIRDRQKEIARLNDDVQKFRSREQEALDLEAALLKRDKALDQLQGAMEGLDAEVSRQVGSTREQIQRDRAVEEQGVRSAFSEKKALLAARRQEISARLAEIAAEKDQFADLIVQAQDRRAVLQVHAEEILAEIGISRRDSQIQAYWARGFSRSGVQSLLLEGIAASFNQLRPRIFPLLTRGIYDVQFSTTSSTAEGEAREKTAFIIRDRGALVSYEVLSGGQRRRIDLGVMLTLALAVAQTRRVPGVLGMLILDEVFGGLDTHEELYETLVQVQKVIPSIYAITHHPDLQSLFPTTLLVRQDAHGVSRLIAQPTTGE